MSRIARLGKWVKPCFTMDLEQTALKLIDLQILCSQSYNPIQFQLDYNRFLNILSKEFIHKSRGITGFHFHRLQCLSFIHVYFIKIVNNQYEKLNQWLIEFEEDLIERTNAIKTWSALLQLINRPEQSKKHKTVGVCFSYLSTLEGFFERDLKICYSIIELSKGKITDKEELNRKDISDIKKALEKHSVDFLFEAWNRHLRNSIAHFSFNWNESNQKIHFRDHHYNKPKKKWTDWKDSFSLNTLLDLNQKAINLNQSITTLFAIMDIRVVVLQIEFNYLTRYFVLVFSIYHYLLFQFHISPESYSLIPCMGVHNYDK